MEKGESMERNQVVDWTFKSAAILLQVIAIIINFWK
jgi:hypothetical protein